MRHLGILLEHTWVLCLLGTKLPLFPMSAADPNERPAWVPPHPVTLVLMPEPRAVVSLHAVLVLCGTAQHQTVASLVEEGNHLFLESLTHIQHELGVLGNVTYCREDGKRYSVGDYADYGFLPRI